VFLGRAMLTPVFISLDSVGGIITSSIEYKSIPASPL